MTYRELFDQLLAKAYTPRPCGDHVEGAYCCATGVLADGDLVEEDPAAVERMLHNFLELDCRAVFEAWFGQREKDELDRKSGVFPLWMNHLQLAQTKYKNGTLDSRVDYLLDNP
jgi:hypothetical protein